MRGLLEELGYRVTACADSRSALVVLATTPHSLVLTAYPLPTSTGDDFVAAVAAIAPRTPIMGIIRRGMREVARDALTNGCREFVSKPVDPELLARLVEGLVRKDTGPLTAHEIAPVAGETAPVAEEIVALAPEAAPIVEEIAVAPEAAPPAAAVVEEIGIAPDAAPPTDVVAPEPDAPGGVIEVELIDPTEIES